MPKVQDSVSSCSRRIREDWIRWGGHLDGIDRVDRKEKNERVI